jgi:hypothetical protein
MQAGERVADGARNARVGPLDGAPSIARRARGPPVQMREQRPVRSVHRARDFDAAAREVRHKVQVERQSRRRQPLVQRQHEAAALGGDEVVRVLDAAAIGVSSTSAPSA